MKQHEKRCNAYEYIDNDHTCNLAKLDFLEDPLPQDTPRTFYVDHQEAKTLDMRCRGGRSQRFYIIGCVGYVVIFGQLPPSQLELDCKKHFK